MALLAEEPIQVASGIAFCGDLIWKDLDSLALVGLERGGETGSMSNG